jgi:putative ABC transport system permease protein
VRRNSRQFPFFFNSLITEHGFILRLKQEIQLALANLNASKLRTMLAVLGILVGTASVVALVSSGNLATQQALAQLQTLGTNLLSVNIFEMSLNSDNQNNLTVAQAIGAKSSSNMIDKVAPYITPYSPTVYEGHVVNASVIGATEELQDTLKIQLDAGRFISPLDHYTLFCVLGHNIYQNLLAIDPSNPLGKQLRIGNSIFTIIGIADQWPQNSFFDQDINQSIIIPIEASYLISKFTPINNIVFKLKNHANIDAVEANITAYLNQQVSHKKTFFHSAKQLIQSMQKQRAILTLLLGLIGSIALLVGGIGIMNIMLVSVVERRREIGIRRALGAKQRDIQSMFLVESVLLSVIGGLLGVFAGIIISFIIAIYSGWEFTVFLMPPIVGFSVSVLIGIFFGFYPAYQASRLNPIETLHSE